MDPNVDTTPVAPAVLQELRQVQVYQVRPDGVLVGYTAADESPLEPGTYLIPGYCVVEEPPEFSEGSQARWDWTAEKWVIEPVEEQASDPDPNPETPSAVKEVSIRQFAQALAETGRLSWPDARAWGARGEVPPPIMSEIEKIEDSTERNRTLMFLEAAKTVESNHPKTLELAAMMDWSDEQLSALMAFAATL